MAWIEGATYSRGFFLGPGLPLARALGSVCPFARLLPGLGPGTPFRRGVSAGVAPAAGVEFASALESLSAEEGRTAGTSLDEAGEKRSTPLAGGDRCEGFRSVALSMTDSSMSGDSFRVTTRELGGFLEPLERPLGVEPAGMMAERRGARLALKGESQSRKGLRMVRRKGGDRDVVHRPGLFSAVCR